MRFFIFYRTFRTCNEDCVLNDVPFRKGLFVIILIRSIHYDPSVWEDPEVFNPERYVTCTGFDVIQNKQLLSYCSVSTPFHLSSNFDLIWMCVCMHIDLLESVIMYIHMCTCTGSLLKRRPSVILVLTSPLGTVQETALE